MKNNILGWMTIMLMAFVCGGLAACGGDDDDNNYGRSEEGSSSSSATIPSGIYYCVERNSVHKSVKNEYSSGNITTARNIINTNNNGYSFYDAAIRVTSGNLFTWTGLGCSLKEPKASDWGGTPIVVDYQTYGSFSAYYFVIDEAAIYDSWKDAIQEGFTYTSGSLKYKGDIFKKIR